jgi:adenine deaminase
VYDVHGNYLLPGFIDGHVHLESSLLSPARYAEAVVPHGTTTVVADPHEIANVTGIAGLRDMLHATERLPLEVYFMVPSCVPATALETAGAELGPSLVAAALRHNRILGLAEVMNYRASWRRAAGLEKVLAGSSGGKLIDGHAPGLGGQALMAYSAPALGRIMSARRSRRHAKAQPRHVDHATRRLRQQNLEALCPWSRRSRPDAACW